MQLHHGVNAKNLVVPVFVVILKVTEKGDAYCYECLQTTKHDSFKYARWMKTIMYGNICTLIQ